MSRSRLVARNVLSMIVTQALTWAVSALAMVYVPRYVGDVVLGRLTLAASFAGFAFLFVNLGTQAVLVRDVAQDHARAGRYLVAVLIQRLGLGLLATLAVAALVHFLDYPAQTKTFICLATALGIVPALSAGAADVLRGQENFPRANAAALVEKVVGALLTILAVELRLPFWALLACGGVAAVLAFAVNLSAFAGDLPRPSRDHVELGRRLAVAGSPFFTNAIFVTIYTQCNPIILQRISGDAALGWYALVVRLFGTCLFIPTIITGAMLPALTRLRAEEPAAFPAAARRMVTFILLCAAPVACVTVFMPAQIIRLLHYPPSFLNAVPVFVLFGVGVVLWYLSIAVGTLLTVMGLQSEFGRASSKAALAVIPLSIACIWAAQTLMHNGAVGAAAAHILVEVYMLHCYLRALPRDLLSPNLIYGLLARTSLAALPTGLILYFAQGRLLLVVLLPCVLLYAALSYSLRCVTRQDLALLRAVLSRKTAAGPAS